MKILITATNTNVGKTFVVLKLIEKLNKINLKTVAIKPIETGVTKEPVDGKKIQTKLKEFGIEVDLDLINPIRFSLPAAPFVANKGKEINLEKIKKVVNRFEKQFRVVLIEGAGGIFTPINKDFFIIDLAKFLKVELTILVVDDRLGCISQALTHKFVLEKLNLNFLIHINHFNKKAFKKISFPFCSKIKTCSIDEIVEFIKNF